MLKKTKKEEEEEEDSTDDKGKRDFYHEEACSSTEREKQREERMAWVSFRAKGKVERWDERNEEFGMRIENIFWFIER